MLGLRATWKLFHYRVSIISLENRLVVELLESTNARPIRHFHNIVKWNITVHCCCCWDSTNWVGLENVRVNTSILWHHAQPSAKSGRSDWIMWFDIRNKQWVWFGWWKDWMQVRRIPQQVFGVWDHDRILDLKVQEGWPPRLCLPHWGQ